MTRIAIIVGSTRPGRRAAAVARWVHDLAAQRADAAFDLVDLADFDLPLLDEPVPAAMGPRYQHAHTRAWSDTVASYDGFVFVTPEYNHSVPAALKNAIDFLYQEWNNKAAGFVGYGVSGGERAVEHLRLVMGELHVADVRHQVSLSMFTDFGDDGTPAPPRHQCEALDSMLEQVIAWSTVLRQLRTNGSTG